MNLDLAAIEALSELEKAAPAKPFQVGGDGDDYILGRDGKALLGTCCCGAYNEPAVLLLVALRNAAPSLIALAKEALAAREWLKWTEAIHQDQEDLENDSDLDLSRLEQEAFDAYQVLVSRHQSGGVG